MILFKNIGYFKKCLFTIHFMGLVFLSQLLLLLVKFLHCKRQTAHIQYLQIGIIMLIKIYLQ